MLCGTVVRTAFLADAELAGRQKRRTARVWKRGGSAVLQKALRQWEQAQGLFFFFYGIAQIVGTYFSTWLIDFNTVSLVSGSVTETANSVVEAVKLQSGTDWNSIFMVESAISAVLLVAFCLLFKNDVKSA